MCMAHIRELCFIEYYAEIKIIVKFYWSLFALFCTLYSLGIAAAWALIYRPSRLGGWMRFWTSLSLFRTRWKFIEHNSYIYLKIDEKRFCWQFDESDRLIHKILYISNLFVLWLIMGYLMASGSCQWCDFAGLPDNGTCDGTNRA